MPNVHCRVGPVRPRCHFPNTTGAKLSWGQAPQGLARSRGQRGIPRGPGLRTMSRPKKARAQLISLHDRSQSTIRGHQGTRIFTSNTARTLYTSFLNFTTGKSNATSPPVTRPTATRLCRRAPVGVACAADGWWVAEAERFAAGRRCPCSFAELAEIGSILSRPLISMGTAARSVVLDPGIYLNPRTEPPRHFFFLFFSLIAVPVHSCACFHCISWFVCFSCYNTLPIC